MSAVCATAGIGKTQLPKEHECGMCKVGLPEIPSMAQPDIAERVLRALVAGGVMMYSGITSSPLSLFD